MPFFALTICIATIVAVVATFPLRLLFGVSVSFQGIQAALSVVTLKAMQILWPRIAGGMFFDALKECSSPAFASRMRSMPEVNGIRAQLKGLFWDIVLGSIVVTGLIVFVPWIGVISAASATVVAAAIAAPPLALVALLLATFCSLFCLGWCARTFAPLYTAFVSVARVSWSFAIIVVVAVGWGWIRAGGSLHTLILDASMAYFYSVVLAKELLGQVATRLTPNQWTQFSTEMRWRLFGFGAPLYLLVRRSPLLVLAALDFFVSCAAVFAHRELQLQPLVMQLLNK
jgi:hypothetical protein